jgi:hypothetical protein
LHEIFEYAGWNIGSYLSGVGHDFIQLASRQFKLLITNRAFELRKQEQRSQKQESSMIVVWLRLVRFFKPAGLVVRCNFLSRSLALSLSHSRTIPLVSIDPLNL